MVSWLFSLPESKTSLSDQSCLYSGLMMRFFATLNSGVMVISLTHCSVPVLTPSSSLKYSPLTAALKRSLKSYFAYPATPYHLASEPSAAMSFWVA